MAQIDFLGDPIFQGIDGNGVPIQGGLIWCYEADNITLKNMYPTIQDAINGTNALSNPVILDSSGRASIVYAGASNFVLENNDIDPITGHGTVIWTADNIGRFGNTVIDPNGNIITEYDYVSNAVNYIDIKNSVTGNSPVISSLGADSNIGLRLKTSGNAGIVISSDSGTSYTIPGSDGPSGYFLGTNGGGLVTWQAPPGLSNIIPSGTMVDYGGTVAPSGWLLCDGSAVSRATYSNLFAVTGTTFGAGDGVNTFNLPDCRRRVRMGSGGTGTGTIGNAVGNTGGEETHTLTSGELANHTHPASAAAIGDHQHSFTYGASSGAAGAAVNVVGGGSTTFTAGAGGHTHTITVSNNSGGGAHNNIQPSIVCLAIIKT